MLTRARTRRQAVKQQETVSRVLEHRGVVQRVQSFLQHDYLFAGGVCTFWRRAWPEHEGLPVSESVSASAAAGSKPGSRAVAVEPQAANAELRLTSLKSATASPSRLAWSLDSGLKWSKEVLEAVLRQPSALAFQVLEIALARDKGKPHWQSDTLSDACAWVAELGKTDVLKWLCTGRVNVAASDSHKYYATCVSAARNGHLETLQWLYDRGFPFGEDVCDEASRNGHLAVLEWVVLQRARDTDCPWWGDDRPWSAKACEWASDNGHDEVVDFLHRSDLHCPCIHDPECDRCDQYSRKPRRYNFCECCERPFKKSDSDDDDY